MHSIIINPNYNGPAVIEDYYRKLKAQDSIARLVSGHNKRFFVLDFKNQRFYYLSEKGAALSSGSDIPLDSITRVYIEDQYSLLGQDKIWRYGFCIISKKRYYRLVSHCRGVMEKMLYGLSNIINTETNKPLFDWEAYKGQNSASQPQGQAPIQYQPAPAEQPMPSTGDTVPNPSQNSISTQRSNKPVTSPRKVPKQLETPENLPQQERKEHLDLGTPNNMNGYRTQPNTPPSNESDDRQGNGAQDGFKLNANQSEEDNKTVGSRESIASKNSLFSEQSNKEEAPRGKGYKEDEANSRTSNVSGVENAHKTRPVKAKVEVLNLEQQSESEKSDVAAVPGGLEVRRTGSFQRQTPRKINGHALQYGFSVGTPKSKFEEEESARFNGTQTPLSQSKVKNPNFWNDNQEMNKETADISVSVKKVKEEKTMDIGNGILVSFPTMETDNKSNKQGLPASYLNMMQEAKKCSPLMEAFPQKKNDVKANNDDDWDKEMFAEDFEPVKSGVYADKSANKDQSTRVEGYRTTSEILAQDNRTNKSRNMLGYKQSEMFVSKEELYNDWDDDL